MRIRLVVTTALLASVVTVPLISSPTPSHATPVAAPAYGTLWTVDTTSNSLTEYAANASGAATPVTTITGADTSLDAPTSDAIDDDGDVFVANSGSDSITEYSPDATGDASPVTTISGPRTGLDAPSSITVSNGDVWVTDPDSNVVEAFTAG